MAHPVVYERGVSRATFASVSAFGDVAHRFVQRLGPDGDFAPGVIQRQRAAPQEPLPHPRQPFRTMDGHHGEPGDEGRSDDLAGSDDVLEVIDHVAACVPAGTLGAVAGAYGDIFGFTQIFDERIEVGGQAMDSRVVQSPSAGVTLTLLEPAGSGDPGQIDEFLLSHGGPGVQHVAFRTPGIAEAVRILEKRGVRFLATPPAYYDALERRLGAAELPVQELRDLNVLADRDPWGLMFQIFTQSVHPRRTLFFELIERRGALTFGSGNIRALYEAVAREHAAARAPAGRTAARPRPGDPAARRLIRDAARTAAWEAAHVHVVQARGRVHADGRRARLAAVRRRRPVVRRTWLVSVQTAAHRRGDRDAAHRERAVLRGSA